jgi:hypothetical protein
MWAVPGRTWPFTSLGFSREEVSLRASGTSATAIDDGLAVIEFVRTLPYVDGARINLY